MASGNGLPLSLRPQPVPEANKAPSSIADFIARVNAQPGGFRNLNEEDLKEQLQEEQLRSGDGSEDGDVAMLDSEEDEGDNDDHDDEPKDPFVVKTEVMNYLNTASNAALGALDFLSLLLSKQNPSTAGLKLSPALREKVGIGSIGADRLDASNSTPERTEDNEKVGLGWLLNEINETRDAAKAAAGTLTREIQAENQYWEEIAGVRQRGWSVCKMPAEKTVLGVRFGFSEATPDFRNQGLAPMRREKDGSIKLDTGPRGQKSERLVVTYQHKGEVIGRSARTLPPTEGSAPLEDRVLDARNTIFAQELWHELTREAKTLLAHNVRLEGLSKLTYTLNEDTTIAFELKPLDEITEDEGTTPYYDNLAETINLALQLLLSYSHRQYEVMRSRPLPPHIPRARGQQPNALLRPIIARLHSIQSMQSCIRYVGHLTQTLRKAGLDSTFVVRTPQPELPTANSNNKSQLSAPQNLMRTLLQPIDFSIRLQILERGTTDLTIRGRTFLFPVTTTNYHINLPAGSPLQNVCAPYKDGYPDTPSLLTYLHIATTRFLTHHHINKLATLGVTSNDTTTWSVGLKGNSIVWSDDDADYELHFNLEDRQESEGGRKMLPPRLELVFEKADADDERVKEVWGWQEGGESEEMGLMERVVKVGEGLGEGKGEGKAEGDGEKEADGNGV